VNSRPDERAELDSFLDPLLGFAHDMLKKQGEFFPFGGTIGGDGKIALAGAHTGDEHPKSQDVFDLMVGGMRAQAEAGVIRAAAICWDIRYRPEGGDVTDAIALSMEHASGAHVVVVQPYSKGRFSGWKFEELVRITAPAPRIFVPRSPPPPKPTPAKSP
jgi:hypothetical protein